MSATTGREAVRAFLCGYKDAQEHTLYFRGPDGENVEPPPVPQEELSRPWQLYFDGLRSAAIDTMAKARREA